MDSETTADAIRHAQFRNTLRGIDRAEVEAYLDGVAARVESLEAENHRLAAQLGDSASRDLESEFDSVGREVSGILQAAREAADSMRERASLDASRWRSESMAESESTRRAAAADAEALRRDAWTTGTELLEQSVAESTRHREQADRDVLTIMGEAEREAHRLTSGARRDAEDQLRSATMDAEKMSSEAAKRSDDIIEAANRQASASQERTRALEQRREELLEELENVRSTLTRLEGSLEKKRDSLDLSAPATTSVKVVPSHPSSEVEVEVWVPGETVRLVQGEERLSPPPERLSAEPEPESEAFEPEEPSEPETTQSQDPEPEPDPEPDRDPDTSDDVGALFASLRADDSGKPVVVPTEPAKAEGTSAPALEGKDWIGERDTRLLPITNRALRGTKKAITELQNIALDSLRTEENWRPDLDEIAEALQADLIAVWAESFACGHGVAEEMTGSKLKRPPTPQSDAIGEFATSLGVAVTAALDEAGDGQRERQSAASRTFRVWRTDEAERRIRELAIHGYEQGIEVSVATV
jgi:DivIVA domain-containing protein